MPAKLNCVRLINTRSSAMISPRKYVLSGSFYMVYFPLDTKLKKTFHDHNSEGTYMVSLYPTSQVGYNSLFFV